MVELFFFIAFPFMGLLTIYLYYRFKTVQDELKKKQKDLTRKLFELQILGEVSEKIGYSLSSKDIASTIATTAEKILPLSSVSYAIIENDHIELTTIVREKIGPNYLLGVKDFVLKGIYEVDEGSKRFPIYEKVKEDIIQKEDFLVQLQMGSDSKPKSYFNIPLVLNGRFTGIINISSVKNEAYQEEDMSMLFKIVNQTHEAIDRLEFVINTEKGKVDALVRSLSSGAIFFSLENNSLKLYTANGAARRFLNIAPDEVDIMGVLSKLPASPNIISEMKNVILQKKSTIYRKTTLGSLHFNIYISPVFKPKTEEIIGVAITLQDITAEVETEKLRSSFTNIVVHELRAPLTAIKGAATLLEENKLTAQEASNMRNVIKNSTERLLEDVTQILDSSKVDSGKMNVVKSKADLNEIIQNSAQQLSYAAHSRSILIDNELDHNIPPFEFDSQRISQVLNNLLSNAIKFSRDNGHIKVTSHLEAGTVKVTVKDEGEGIDEDKIPTLFKPFSQLNTGKRTNGTGLGLYITKAIVEAHGGAITIVSHPGKGTSITFTLPVVLHEETTPLPSATAPN